MLSCWASGSKETISSKVPSCRSEVGSISIFCACDLNFLRNCEILRIRQNRIYRDYWDRCFQCFLYQNDVISFHFCQKAWDGRYGLSHNPVMIWSDICHPHRKGEPIQFFHISGVSTTPISLVLWLWLPSSGLARRVASNLSFYTTFVTAGGAALIAEKTRGCGLYCRLNGEVFQDPSETFFAKIPLTTVESAGVLLLHDQARINRTKEIGLRSLLVHWLHYHSPLWSGAEDHGLRRPARILGCRVYNRIGLIRSNDDVEDAFNESHRFVDRLISVWWCKFSIKPCKDQQNKNVLTFHMYVGEIIIILCVSDLRTCTYFGMQIRRMP